ncbi:MAG: recombinase RecJ [Thermoplasmata archaeon]|nr:MAG: recombinase RecJ [Thermoplasmata archaeon]
MWWIAVLDRAKSLADIIRKHEDIHIVTHIDADGITSGAIAVQALSRLGKNYSIEFIKQLDPSTIERIRDENHELVWFTDLGSSISNSSLSMIISDHHMCTDDSNSFFHLNPHLFGLDGSIYISGAGVTYLVAKMLDSNNIDLSALAIIGACGDLQEHRYRRLVGGNREILKDAIDANVVRVETDIQYFGRETRPIHKLLQYSTDPIIPGISGYESNSLSFLYEKKILLKDNSSWRRWIDLSKEEKRIILSGIAQRLLLKGFGHNMVKKLIGEVYTLPREEVGTELHDAKEFATLLNSTARYGYYDVGLQVCLGDRDKWLKKARSLLRGHRQNLVEGVQYVKGEGIKQRRYLQFFHAGNGVRDTIVGIVTNMLLNDSNIRNDIPLVGFADKNSREVKASIRTTQSLVDQGVDLSVAIRKAASHVNGVGGGHSIAAGATIPKGEEERFLEALEEEIKTQLSSSKDVL